MDFGSAVGRAQGLLTEEDIHHLTRWRESDRFTEDERLVLELAEAMTRTPADVPDDLFERLRARFSPDQLVELAMICATENLVARFNRVFAIEAQGFSEGDACTLPDPAP